MSQTLDAVLPQAKTSLKDQLREDRKIGKMTTAQIFGYLFYRHRTFLWALAFFASNVLWIVLSLKVHAR